MRLAKQESLELPRLASRLQGEARVPDGAQTYRQTRR